MLIHPHDQSMNIQTLGYMVNKLFMSAKLNNETKDVTCNLLLAELSPALELKSLLTI